MVSGHRPVVCLVTGYIEQGMSLARNLTLSDSVGVFFIFGGEDLQASIDPL